MTKTQSEILPALKTALQTEDICVGKGGYFVKDKGFISTAQARKITGIEATETRNPGVVMSAGGEWAWVAAINRCL